MAGVSIAWVILIRQVIQTFRDTPHMPDTASVDTQPSVSVILPARNEVGFIEKCLDSLTIQDYSHYEVIAIDDSSEDATGDIIKEYAGRYPFIKAVRAQPKPPGWIGKNWACMEGYGVATGELLLFTDSDTTFASHTISSAVSLLLNDRLDALTAMPHIRADDFWTRISLPVISVFLHTRFSPTKVNDPQQKTGYFFGSFYLLRREVYEKAGTHQGVRQEIIEDGALGRKIKDMGYRLRMVNATRMINAVWARDRTTLWDALKRLMVPMYLQSSKVAVGIWCSLAFLLFLPFPFTLLGGIMASEIPGMALLATSASASALAFCGVLIESRLLRINRIYATACPAGGAAILAGFLAGMFMAKRKNAVRWRGRSYTLRDHAQNIRV